MRFVDTNILLYSLDLEPANAGKTAIAAEILTCTDLVLSVQVLRKIWRDRPLDVSTPIAFRRRDMISA